MDTSTYEPSVQLNENWRYDERRSLSQKCEGVQPSYEQVECEKRLRGFVNLTEIEHWWAKERKLPEGDNPPDRTGTGKTLAEGIHETIKHSLLGCFVSEWNQSTTSYADAIAMVELCGKEQILSDWIDNEVAVIKSLLQAESNGSFPLKAVQKKLTVLRLVGKKIQFLDDSFKKYENIHSLVMSINWLNYLNCSFIPQTIRFLELHGNEITHINNIDTANDNILYLGLSRNFISKRSSLLSLTRFNSLCCLDLSNNDIIDLAEILNDLKTLAYLRSLSLYGNPCAYMYSYRRLVLDTLPELMKLDGIDLKKCFIDFASQTRESEDVKKVSSDKNDVSFEAYSQMFPYNCGGALVINLLKLLHLPKQKRIPQRLKAAYKIEVECPLINPDFIQEQMKYVNDPLEVVGLRRRSENIPNKKKQYSHPHVFKKESLPHRDYVKTCFDTGEKTSLEGGLPSEQHHRIGPGSSFCYECDEVPSSAYVSSKAMRWSKNMGCIITIPTKRLTALRDTFRSILNLYIVYIVYKKTKSKGTRLTAGSASSAIMDRKVLAKIPIPLEEIKWNEESVLYKWSADDAGEASKLDFDGVLSARHKRGLLASKIRETALTALVGVAATSEERDIPGFLSKWPSPRDHSQISRRVRSSSRKSSREFRHKQKMDIERTIKKIKKMAAKAKKKKHEALDPMPLKFKRMPPVMDPMTECVNKCKNRKVCILETSTDIIGTIEHRQRRRFQNDAPKPKPFEEIPRTPSTPHGSTLKYTQLPYF